MSVVCCVNRSEKGSCKGGKMIPGLNSSSVASAIRTSAKARLTMDTMSRQIATGQRVSSVKDDGAAWSRANAARGNAAARETLADNQDFMRAGVRWAAEVNHRIDAAARASQLAALATVGGASASTVAALQAEYTEVRNGFNTNTYGQAGTDLVLTRADGTGAWVPFSGGTMAMATLSWVDGLDGAARQWTPSTLQNSGTNQSVTNSISTAGLAAAAKAVWDTVANDFRVVAAELGSLEGRLENTSRTHRNMAERELALAASMTDADMGKASSSLRQAETRQQLAVQTVRTAISAYGNLASGLLGNVQRTQRAIA
jgi:flagellin-like hook-associated protein FlgL